MNMSIFEAGMLICFGFAWPINIYKSLTSRSTGGKSMFFSIVVDIGYIFGIIHKLLYSPDLVLYLYILNLLMVTCDLCLFFRNRKWERRQALEAENACRMPESKPADAETLGDGPEHAGEDRKGGRNR